MQLNLNLARPATIGKNEGEFSIYTCSFLIHYLLWYQSYILVSQFYLNKFDIPYDPADFVFVPSEKGTGDTALLEAVQYHHEHGNDIKEIQL